MSDSSERTEKPSDRHLDKVRKDGKLGRSQDLSTWIGIAAGAVMLPSTISAAADHAMGGLFESLAVAQHPDPQTAVRALADGFGGILGTVAPLLIVVCAAAVGAQVLQGGLRFVFKPHFTQLDLVSGVKRLVGPQALWQGGKSLLKLAAVGLAMWMVTESLVPTLTASGSHTIAQLVATAKTALTGLLVAAIAAGLAIAGLDVMVVLRRNRRMSMMTKREVKDEAKSNEGDPQLRQARRSRQLSLTRTRMLSAVGEADVVLLNPTHYAVALRYEPGKSAPRVVAKGQDNVAARIREEAEARKVPMIRDVPLTRALHAAVPLGGEIPPEFYTVIAQVLTFVALLKRRGAAHGVHDLPGGAR